MSLNFKEFKTKFETHFEIMSKKYEYLFEINLDKDELYNTYLNTIPSEDNKIYKTRRELLKKLKTKIDMISSPFGEGIF